MHQTPNPLRHQLVTSPLTLVSTDDLMEELTRRAPAVMICIEQYDAGKKKMVFRGNVKEKDNMLSALSGFCGSLLCVVNWMYKDMGVDKYKCYDVVNESIFGGNDGIAGGAESA